MNFIQELMKLGMGYTLEPRVAKLRPDSLKARPAVHVTISFPEGPVVERDFFAGDEVQIHALLVDTLRGEPRAASLLRRWFDFKGNVPVKMAEGLLENDMVPELVHTALRKCASSKTSNITWNGLHRMHQRHRGDFWALVTRSLTEAFASTTNGAPPTRRAVATKLRDDIATHFDEISFTHIARPSGRQVELEPEDRFALIAFEAACALTTMDEWMWGWLGFAVEDIEPEAAVEPAQAAAAA